MTHPSNLLERVARSNHALLEAPKLDKKNANKLTKAIESFIKNPSKKVKVPVM